MATLTQTAYYTRRALKIGAVLLIGFFVVKTSFRIVKNVWQRLNPPPPPPPTVAFGKLPKINFPQQEKRFELKFQLETIEGGLPQLPNVGKVYFMPKQRPNLLALDRAKEKARKMGFHTKPEAISETVYRWTNQETPPTILEMDINNNNFYFRYLYENDQGLLKEKYLPNNQQATQEAKNFLKSRGFLADDLATGPVEFDYLRFSPSGLTPAISLSEADFIRIKLFRSNLDNLKILPPNPQESLISFLFSGSRRWRKRIVEIKYTYFPIEKETFATYPLKSIEKAWQELQEEKAYIANFGENKSGQTVIRKIYLAYYDSAEPQNYLQPIYVFEGDQSFLAYVSAIDPQWTE